MKFLSALIYLTILIWSNDLSAQKAERDPVKVGAEQVNTYLPMLKGKKVGLVVNQTSVINEVHILDTLLSMGVDVKKIFAPEHGFRGLADAGKHINNSIDVKTGIPIISLYGKNQKPGPDLISDLDWVVFDIQDVGARFYTYISTMHYVMEACAEAGVSFMVLDRPNPNGHFVDGPVLDMEFKTFTGMHPVPVVHGMTVGEYAQMINGEGWLKAGMKCKLMVISCTAYDHNTMYDLPINPSPNLTDMRAIYLYPSLCFFEGTVMSVGRGTNHPFQQYGHPAIKGVEYYFTPETKIGASKPKHKGMRCYGRNLRIIDMKDLQSERKLSLNYVIDAYTLSPDKTNFFNHYFNDLAGGAEMKAMIKAGKTAEEISASWSKDLDAFKLIRKKYLLYKDFE